MGWKTLIALLTPSIKAAAQRVTSHANLNFVFPLHRGTVFINIVDIIAGKTIAGIGKNHLTNKHCPKPLAPHFFDFNSGRFSPVFGSMISIPLIKSLYLLENRLTVPEAQTPK